jgi:hypothetical protein
LPAFGKNGSPSPADPGSNVTAEAGGGTTPTETDATTNATTPRPRQDDLIGTPLIAIAQT